MTHMIPNIEREACQRSIDETQNAMMTTEMRRKSTNRLFFWIFLLLSSISPALTFDVTSNVTIHFDEQGRQFILIDEGDSIELTCENFQGSHEWVPPDNSDIKDFSFEERETRIKKFTGHDEAEQKLTLSSAKVTDTGLYGCKYDHHIQESVYVFVQSSQFFLKSAVQGYQVHKENFTIPCRSSWPPLDEEGTVELYVEHELWKEATKYYDPRTGFDVTAKVLNGRKIDTGKAFECKYRSESVRFLISPKPEPVSEDDFKLSFDEDTEFPYVGGSLVYNCTVSGNGVHLNSYVHFVNSTYPRGKEKYDMHHNLMHATNQLTNRTTLNNLSSQDSGAYTCRWFMEGDEGYIQRGEITKTITVSSTKEQIKMLNRSDSYMEIKEGEGLHIFAIFRTFPEDRTQYSSKWFKLSVDALKGINDTTNVINDGQNTVHTSFEGKDVIETVSITNTSVATSGLYALEVTVHNFTRRVEWNVRVRGRVMTPHIMFSSQSSNVLFDQSSYKIGAEIRLVCYVESFPKAEVQLKTRIMGQNVWEGVGGAIAIEGTYAKGYVLNFTASENVEFKCEGRRKEEPPVSKIMAVIIHDFPPDANVSWVKPDSATSETEIKNVIYEGDKIELDCNVPKANNSTMEWSFRGKRTTYSERTTITNNTRHLIATIDAAVSDQSGTYVCTVINEKNVSQTETYSRSFEVVKIVKPRCRDCGPIEMTVKFGNAIDLTCSMDGIPEPRYKWLKDGYEVEDQSQVSLNGQTLHFPRVGIPDEGTYTCQAYNRAGTTPLVYKLKVKGAPKTLSAMSIFFIVLAFLVLLGCLVAAFILYTRQRKKSKEQARSLQVLYEQLMRGSDSDAPPLPMHGKVTMDMRVRRTAYDPKYEIDMKNLVLLGALGSGQFGSVRKGRLVRGAPVSDTVAYRGPALTVAIKSPRNGSNPEDQKALIDELKILIAIDNLEETKHPNVLSLVGAVTRNMKDGQLFVVFEMCENGDLKTFLQRYKTELKDKFLNELKEKKAQESSADDYLVPNNQTTVQYMSQGDPGWHDGQERDRLLEDPKTLSTSDLISFSMQIASGMDFLSGVSCIHRDLAARNCLLNANKVVKIADFGMAKNEDKGYYRMNKTNVMVPYRWMAPESMEEHTFTVESDIWSYGIVIYEIFTLGSQPYPGVPNNNLHEHLKSGQRNPRPEFCHPDIYNLMLQTWDKDSERRPTFGHCYNFMRHQLELLNPEMLESSDKQIDRNAAQIAQFDQFRGPRATAVLDEEELAAIFTDQRSPISNGRNNEDEIGERIYIKELRR